MVGTCHARLVDSLKLAREFFGSLPEAAQLGRPPLGDTRRAFELAQQMNKELYDMYVGIPIVLRNAVWALDPLTICGDWQPIDGTPSHTMFNTLVPC